MTLDQKTLQLFSLCGSEMAWQFSEPRQSTSFSCDGLGGREIVWRKEICRQVKRSQASGQYTDLQSPTDSITSKFQHACVHAFFYWPS